MRRLLRGFFLLSIFLAAGLLQPAVFAEEVSSQEVRPEEAPEAEAPDPEAVIVPKASGNEPVSVTGDLVEYFDTEGKVVASGHVTGTYQTMKLTCDRAVIYLQSKDAYLTGRVRLVQPDGLMKGDEILYNFKTGKGTVVRAEGEAGPWRSVSDEGTMTAPTSFLHERGYVTTCDFEEPHTRFEGRRAQVFLDDRVVMKRVIMRIGSVPVLYLPSYTHLLDDKRPRVTLIPGKDKNWGLFLLSAWRVYVNEDLQGRFHIDYREKRDWATGIDLNYRIPNGGEGIFREYYTHERLLQRDHFYSSFTSPDDDRPTTEKERYRFQLRHRWDIEDVGRFNLEINRTKDPSFLQDFFEKEFEAQNGPGDTFAEFVRSTSWYGLNVFTSWRSNRFESKAQSLPQINLNIRPREVGWIPSRTAILDWFGGLSGKQAAAAAPADPAGTLDRQESWYYQSDWIYEHSNTKDAVDGTENSLHVFDMTQELYHPMRWFNWLNLRPFAQFRHTAYSKGAQQQAPQFRQAGGGGIELNTRLFRVFPIETNWLGLNIHKLRHIITPAVTYSYQGKPTIDSAQLRGSTLEKSNTVRPSIEQKFQTKRLVDGEWQKVDLARFITEIRYDLEGADGVGGEWNDLTMDLEAVPYDWLRVESDATIDPHIGKMTAFNADLVFRPNVGGLTTSAISAGEYSGKDNQYNELPWVLGLGWRYTRNTSSQLTMSTEFDLGPKWRIGYYHALDVKRFVTETSPTDSRVVKKIYDFADQQFRIRRDFHEWTAELIYGIERQEGETLLLLFRLKAFPDMPFEFQKGYHQPKAGRNFPKQ